MVHAYISISVLMSGIVLSPSLQYNYNTGISYETLGPDELRSLLTTVSHFNLSILPSIHKSNCIGSYLKTFISSVYDWLVSNYTAPCLQQCGVISEHTKKMCTR
jgi:hypothetical protein